MKIEPITIKLTSTADVDALTHALECNIDITADMLTDDLPYKAETIRELAAMSDAEIEQRLKELRDGVDQRITNLESMQKLLQQLKSQPVRNFNGVRI